MKKNIYLTTLIFILCSCNSSLNGEWKSIVATNKNIVSASNTNITPFNTIMQLNYFFDDNNENNEKLFNELTKIYDDKVAFLHKQFDRHYSYLDVNNELITNIKTINDSYGSNEKIKCSEEVYNLIKIGIECFELTNGLFNIFTGSITNFWENNFARYYDMGSDETLVDYDPYYNISQKERLALLVDSIPSSLEEINQQITMNDDEKTIIFNKCEFNNEIKPIISVGGIAKGFATDIIKQELLNAGYDKGYLISGASSITTLSKPIFSKKQNGQSISVINPEKSNFIEKEKAFSLKFKNSFSFSTSGNYTDGKNYRFLDDENNLIYRHHIVNPLTGYPESYYRSISIATSYFSNVVIDALSTAFMNLSIDDGLLLRNEILEKYPEADLELIYLIQEGYKDNSKYYVFSTSNFDNTLVLSKDVNIINEK